MLDTAIYIQMTKIGHLYTDYWLQQLFTFAENEWFMPNNGDADKFTICDSLSRLNLIQKKIIPRWINGSFRGNFIYFKYNKELKYTD